MRDETCRSKRWLAAMTASKRAGNLGTAKKWKSSGKHHETGIYIHTHVCMYVCMYMQMDVDDFL